MEVTVVGWIWIGILILVIMVGVAVKIRLRRKLDDIDGLNGVHVRDENRAEENVIGTLGDDRPKKEYRKNKE